MSHLFSIDINLLRLLRFCTFQRNPCPNVNEIVLNPVKCVLFIMINCLVNFVVTI